MENQYLNTLSDILERGVTKSSGRANMPDTIAIFGHQMQHDLSYGFPLYTTKKINFKHIIHELNWFIKGHTSVKYLEYYNCRFWHDDSYAYYKKVVECIVDETNNYESFRRGHESKELPIEYTDLFNSDLFVPLNGNEFTIDELTNFSEAFRILTKEEYLKKLRFWGDHMRKVEFLTPQLLDECIITTISVEGLWKTKEEFFDNLKDVTRGRFTYYDFGYCGAQYGMLWRNLLTTDINGVNPKLRDQFGEVVYSIKTNPFGRRHVIDSWNVGTLDTMALNACHPFVQFNVRPESDENHLDCSFYMRSNDMFLGNPYNIAFYALLTHVIAAVTGNKVGNLIYSVGDCHIYTNHVDAVLEQLTREPKPLPSFDMSALAEGSLSIDLFKRTVESYELNLDIYVGLDNVLDELFDSLKGYEPYSPIKAELSTGN